jgi:hypothetical protein
MPNQPALPKFFEAEVTILRSWVGFGFGVAEYKGRRYEIFVRPGNHSTREKNGHWEKAEPMILSQGDVIFARICTRPPVPGQKPFALFWHFKPVVNNAMG